MSRKTPLKGSLFCMTSTYGGIYVSGQGWMSKDKAWKRGYITWDAKHFIYSAVMWRPYYNILIRWIRLKGKVSSEEIDTFTNTMLDRHPHREGKLWENLPNRKLKHRRYDDDTIKLRDSLLPWEKEEWYEYSKKYDDVVYRVKRVERKCVFDGQPVHHYFQGGVGNSNLFCYSCNRRFLMFLKKDKNKDKTEDDYIEHRIKSEAKKLQRGEA